MFLEGTRNDFTRNNRQLPEWRLANAVRENVFKIFMG